MQAELVQVVDAAVLPYAVELFHKFNGEDRTNGLRERLPAGHRVHHFHLGIPALDAVFHIEGHDADIDGLDDVLVEIFQPLVLGDLLLQRSVQTSVLDGDSEITAQSFEELDIFAR